MKKQVEAWVDNKDLEKGFIYYVSENDQLNYLVKGEKTLKMGDKFNEDYFRKTEWLLEIGVLKVEDKMYLEFKDYSELFEGYNDMFEFELLKTQKEIMNKKQLIYWLYSNYTGGIFGWFDETATIEEKMKFADKINEIKSDAFIDLVEMLNNYDLVGTDAKTWEYLEYEDKKELYIGVLLDFKKISFVFDEEDMWDLFDEALIRIMQRIYAENDYKLWEDLDYNFYYLK